MKTIIEVLEEKTSRALAKVSGIDRCPAIVRPAKDGKFGDYQVNGVMGVAKRLKTNPRQLAEQVVGQLDLAELCEPPEIAGPGFINLRLKSDTVGQAVLRMAADEERLGVGTTAQVDTVVVDFSSPNVAKQMHVGHLRSTILGDSIARMLAFQGHRVIRQNHIGDWGTQFGMLIAYLRETSGQADADIHIDDLEQFYRSAKQRFDDAAAFADTARQAVVGLQAHEPESVAIWQKIVDASRGHYQPIYDQLHVQLAQANECGESFYNDKLPAVVTDLKAEGLAQDSDGAVCVFPDGFKNKQGDPMPFIIQKSDGGYLYATTDLAALRYRVSELKADRIVYVTDSRQKLHFDMLFTVARSANWSAESELSHVMFGTVLGDDGTPLKTRSGENVKLQSLLDEAVERSLVVVEEKNPDLAEDQKQRIAAAVGIGAVKYADYSNNRTSDYVFSFDKMLAMEGNTAPYMQYAYARVQSIGRKAQERGVDVAAELQNVETLDLSAPEALDLAKHLVRYGEAIDMAVADYRPNYLTTYLFELAQKFSTFYTHCPVLTAEGNERASRLMLCAVTARVIKHGLHELLGIEVVEQM